MTSHTTEQERQAPIKMHPGDDLHLTVLMASHGLNFVTGKDREQLLAWGRDVWQAARSAPVATPQKGDYLDGVNIPRLREALTFLGRGNGASEGCVAGKLSEYVNSITRAVLACKELLRSGDPVALKAGTLADEFSNCLKQCRNAYPPPPAGTELERLWLLALDDVTYVPDYIKALATVPKPPEMKSNSPEFDGIKTVPQAQEKQQ